MGHVIICIAQMYDLYMYNVILLNLLTVCGQWFTMSVLFNVLLLVYNFVD